MQEHRLSADTVAESTLLVWACVSSCCEDHMANFKYDLNALFELVAARPCIWNKYSEQYKHKSLRDESWQEIFRALDDTYENQSDHEKKQNGEIIFQKWTNIRDAFIRSLRIKSAKKKYRYADHLQFLLHPNEPSSSYINSNINEPYAVKREYIEEDESFLSNIETSNSSEPYSKKEKLTGDFGFDFAEVEPTKKSRSVTESEDAAYYTSIESENFFSSFVPYIRDMTEDEKLDLHLEIITAIKRIRQRRRDSSCAHPSTSISNI